ncbi:hypothetical protein COCOBI_11-2380 [Coccomyxa sp. Obi]|nr:hypothetical protein COCOBI_11-2380 [Coccomyxa sp. Obi]
MLGIGTHERAIQHGERISTQHFSSVTPEKQKDAGLQTSTDFIKFYRQYCDSSSLPFILCKRASDGNRFRSYDLTVVDDASIYRQEYFHVSADSITRIVGGDRFEHVLLKQWDEERRQFDHLCQLGFFRNFLIRRAFNTWRRAIQLISLPVPGKHYEIDRWADLQTSNREQHAKPALDALLKTAEQEAENVCRLVGRRAREWAQSVRDLSELADDTGVEMLVRQHRPMVMIKAEKRERARMFKQVMEDARLMGNFVRLVDIMVTEALASHVIASVQQLLAALEASNTVVRDPAATPWFLPFGMGTFITTVSFTSGGAIQCSPDGFSVADTIITNAVEGAVALVSTCPRLVRGRSFVPSMMSTQLDSMQYKKCCTDIEGVVMRDFERAHNAAALLEEHRAALDFCSALTEEISLIRTKADIQDNLQQVSDWHAGILKLSEGVIYHAQREQHAAVLSQAEDVNDLYSLLAAYEQRAPTADQVKHDDLKEAVLQFSKMLADTEAQLALLSCQT